MFIQEKTIVIRQAHDEVAQSVHAWQQFLATFDWRTSLQDIKPLYGGCGTVWELPNFLNRENESFAIVDMSDITYAEPHYHPTGSTEIYIVLKGKACVVVAGKERHVTKGDVIIIEANKAHFSIPYGNFIIAAINIPSFRKEDYIPLTETNEAVGFDKDQLKELVGKLG